MEQQKITLFSSIRTKIVIVVAVWAVIAGAVEVFFLLPGAKSEIESTTKSYMRDLAKAYGTMLSAELES